HRHQDQVEDAVVLRDTLVVEEDLVDREGNVVLGLELDDVTDFLRGHLRNLNLLDDQFPATDRDRAARAFESRPGYRAPDGLYHDGRVFDGTVRDGIRGEGRIPQRGQRWGTAGLLDVDCYHTCHAYVLDYAFWRHVENR